MNEYKVFNDVKFDIDNYEEIDIDKEVIKSKVKAKLNKRKNISKKVLVASIAGLIMVGGLFVYRQPVYANMYKVMYDIKNALGIDSNLNDYKTVVGKSITENGLTITLNEVILDKDELIVSTTYQYEKELEQGNIMSFGYIYINGELINLGAGGGSTAIDKNTVEEVLRYDIGKEVHGDLDVKIVYRNPMYFENNTEKTIDGEWVFEFKTNGDELAYDTKTLALNQSFDLGNDETITLKEYRTNALGPSILFDKKIHNKELANYDIKLVGKDDLGNDVEFYLMRSDQKEGKLTLYNLEQNLDENATKLNLVPYAAKQPNTSGKMNDDFKKVGSEFTIDLTQLK